jgi:hypothetical protein
VVDKEWVPTNSDVEASEAELAEAA